jgi:ribosome biogenesis protein UTP30
MAKATSKSVQKDELIDSRVSEAQCKKAVDALTNHAAKVSKERDENELLGGKEENVWLVLTVKRSHPEKKLKPQRM